MDYHKLSRTFDFDCLKRLPSSLLSATNNISNNLSNGHLNYSASPSHSIISNNNNHSQPKKLAWSSETVESLVNSSANLLLSPSNSLFIPSLKNRSQPIPIKKAANVFWFGDLNFRVLPIQQLVGIGKQLENKLFRRTLDYESIIENDELNLERSKGLLFEDFKEGVIKFPPTHKFVIGTSNYADNRVPSYTDRVLYWSNSPSGLTPLRYDCIWEITTSDHKPVYCLFGMKVVERTQLLPESTFNLPGAIIDLSDTLVRPANTYQNGHIL